MVTQRIPTITFCKTFRKYTIHWTVEYLGALPLTSTANAGVGAAAAALELAAAETKR